MEFFWAAKAQKDLRLLHKKFQEHISEKMRWYAAQNDPLHFAKPLTDMPDTFRFRIGEYRVIISPDGSVLSILRIQKRSEVYRRS